MKILLIDDHALFSKSLEISLEDVKEINIFLSTQDVEHIIEKLLEFKPDILLLDINLKNSNAEDGLFVIKSMLEKIPVQKIVIFTGYDLSVYQHEV